MRVLVTCAHADDVEPQMGGTIAKLTSFGHEVLIYTAIIPCQDVKGNVIEGAKDNRRIEAINAAKTLGAQLHVAEFDPVSMKFDRELVQDIDAVQMKFKPSAVFTLWQHDSHQDHHAVAHATFSATRKNLSDLYMMSPVIPGGLVPESFAPNVFVDISDFLEQKMESIRAYKSQVALYPNWLEATEARTRFYGFQANVPHAEAFQVVRHQLRFENLSL